MKVRRIIEYEGSSEDMMNLLNCRIIGPDNFGGCTVRERQIQVVEGDVKEIRELCDLMGRSRGRPGG